jgi:hypothetical protein
LRRDQHTSAELAAEIRIIKPILLRLSLDRLPSFRSAKPFTITASLGNIDAGTTKP